MLTRTALCAFCADLLRTTCVVQWGNADVYKAAGKVFAVIGMGNSGATVTFKASEMAFEIPSGRPDLHPDPYMASRG